MKTLALVSLIACGRSEVIEPSKPTPTPPPEDVAIEADVRPRQRMVSPEAFLRSYLTWFGGLTPLDVQKRGGRSFDQWNDYLGALGLPDYRVDIPRAGQSNAIMLAAIGRLGEVLCVRAVDHDLRQTTPLAQRQIFAFDKQLHPSFEQFTARFDVLHQTFLSYPAELAPAGRVARFYALYQKVEAEHEDARAPLTADEAAWAAICTALVQHPEAEVY